MPKSQKQTIEVDGRELTVSNLDKVYFPESGFTKGEVLRFYLEIADVLLPHLEDLWDDRYEDRWWPQRLRAQRPVAATAAVAAAS